MPGCAPVYTVCVMAIVACVIGNGLLCPFVILVSSEY